MIEQVLKGELFQNYSMSLRIIYYLTSKQYVITHADACRSCYTLSSDSRSILSTSLTNNTKIQIQDVAWPPSVRLEVSKEPAGYFIWISAPVGFQGLSLNFQLNCWEKNYRTSNFDTTCNQFILAPLDRAWQVTKGSGINFSLYVCSIYTWFKMIVTKPLYI